MGILEQNTLSSPSLSVYLHLCLYRRGFPGEAWSLQGLSGDEEFPQLGFNTKEEVALTLVFLSPPPIQKE